MFDPTPFLGSGSILARYRADQGLYAGAGGTTPCVSDGDRIQEWHDLGPNAWHLVQATANNRPVFRATSMFQTPAVSFSFLTFNQYLQNTSYLATLPYTVIMVFAVESGFAYDGTSGTVRNAFGQSSSNLFMLDGVNNAFSPAGETPFAPSVVTVSYPAGGGGSIWRNGVLKATEAASAATNSSGLTLGAAFTGTLPLNGLIMECLVITGTLSTGNRTAIEAQMTADWLASTTYPQMTYALAASTTNLAGPPATALLNGGAGVVGSGTTSGSVCTTIDFGFSQNVTSITGRICYNYTETELWEWSVDTITWTTFVPHLALATYVFGADSYSTADQVWTPVTGFAARYIRLSVTDTGPAGEMITPGVLALGASAPALTTGGALTITGNVYHNGLQFAFGGPGGAPWEGVQLSFVVKTQTTFTSKTGFFSSGTSVVSGPYCSDGDITVTTVTTDCNGAYSFSGANVAAIGIFLGPMRINPNFDPSRFVGFARDSDGILFSDYIVTDVSATGWVGAIEGDAFTLGDVDLRGTLLAFSAPGTQSTLTDGSPVNGCGTPPLANPAHVADGYLLETKTGGYFPDLNTFNPVQGTFTLDIQTQFAGQEHIYFCIRAASGILYDLGVQFTHATVHDSCGKSVLWTSSGSLPFPYVIDWYNISLVDNIVYNTLINCSNFLSILSPAPAPLREIYPVNRIHDPPDLGRLGQLGPGVLPVVQGLAVIVLDCTAPAGSLFAVDSFDGIISVAWIKPSTGALKTASHFAPSRFVGNSANGWQATQTIETAGVSQLGEVYLITGRLALYYTTTSNVMRFSDDLGATWSASRPASAGTFDMGARSMEQTLRVLDGAVIQQCSDNRGVTWSAGSAPPGVTSSSHAAGAWMGFGHGVLFVSGTTISFATSPDLITWTVNSVGVSGTVCGLTRLDSGRLVGLIVVGTDFKTCVSDDRGRTWTVSSPIVFTPDTSMVPKIVEASGLVYIVYLFSDFPKYLASPDCVNWT
jgi:hypothetical protein